MNNKSLQFLNDRSDIVAPRLLGCILEREINGQIVRGKIVETEAYSQDDAASHSYKGKTPRTDVMFGPAGHLYVYFTYGMHYCCNVVTEKAGIGSAVLIRAIEPIEGLHIMKELRGKTGLEITNGPAKLCQALCIDNNLNGHNLTNAPLKLIINPSIPSEKIAVTTRVGISKAKDVPWRFYIKNNPYVSGK